MVGLVGVLEFWLRKGSIYRYSTDAFVASPSRSVLIQAISQAKKAFLRVGEKGNIWNVTGHLEGLCWPPLLSGQWVELDAASGMCVPRAVL